MFEHYISSKFKLIFNIKVKTPGRCPETKDLIIETPELGQMTSQ